MAVEKTTRWYQMISELTIDISCQHFLQGWQQLYFHSSFSQALTLLQHMAMRLYHDFERQ